MPIGQATRRAISRTALLATLASSLILVGVVILSLGSDRSVPTEATAEAPAAPAPQAPGGPGVDDQIGKATASHIQLIDRRNPTRIAWDIEADLFDPVPGTDRVIIERPRGWALTDPENPAYFSADRATLNLRTLGQEPDTGVFEGRVDIRIYPGLEVTDDTDPDAIEPSVRIRTPALAFDSLRGEVSSEQHVDITGTGIDATLQGLVVIVDQENQRVESARSPRGGVITYNRTQRARAAPTPTQTPVATPVSFRATTHQAAISAAESQTDQPQPTPAESEQTYYAGQALEDVVLTQLGRRVTAERLDLFGMLTDGSLSNDAVRELARAAPVPLRHALLTMPFAQVSSGTSGEPDGGSGAVRLTWTGELLINRVDDKPEPLEADELAVVFHAVGSTPVRFADEASNATGQASYARYGLTNAHLRLLASEAHPLWIEANATGRLDTEHLEISLDTGVGAIPGPGSLTTTSGPERAITWQGRGDFLLANDADNRSIETATFDGGVTLIDARLRASGEELRTSFDPTSTRGAAALRRAHIIGRADAQSNGGSLTADDIDVRFTDTGETDEPVPTALIATGNVRASRDGTTVEGSLLEADLRQNPRTGDPDIATAYVEGTADTPARFDRADGVFALGATLRTDAVRGTTQVLGTPEAHARVGSNEGEITGESVFLEQDRDLVAVPGAGTFQRIAGGVPVARADWSGSMQYVGETGELEAFGDVTAVATPDALATDIIRADRLYATITPGTGLEASSSGPASSGPAPGVDLQSLRAVGTEQAPASVESLRRSEPGAEPDRAIYAQGPVITADNARAKLRIDGKGRLVLADLRPNDDTASSPPEGDSPGDASDARGAALFDWVGDMRFDRTTGRIDMRRSVSMVRRDVDGTAGGATELQSERLTAFLSPAARAGTLLADDDQPEQPDDDATIERVVATGAVWARKNLQQIVGDVLTYDARAQTARVEAPASGLVTVFDGNTGTDVTATAVDWDLAANRIDLTNPGPVLAPR